MINSGSEVEPGEGLDDNRYQNWFGPQSIARFSQAFTNADSLLDTEVCVVFDSVELVETKRQLDDWMRGSIDCADGLCEPVSVLKQADTFLLYNLLTEDERANALL